MTVAGQRVTTRRRAGLAPTGKRTIRHVRRKADFNGDNKPTSPRHPYRTCCEVGRRGPVLLSAQRRLAIRTVAQGIARIIGEPNRDLRQQPAGGDFHDDGEADLIIGAPAAARTHKGGRRHGRHYGSAFGTHGSFNQFFDQSARVAQVRSPPILRHERCAATRRDVGRRRLGIPFKDVNGRSTGGGDLVSRDEASASACKCSATSSGRRTL